jgi:uncharacterized RDD family membrane protein YckC
MSDEESRMTRAEQIWIAKTDEQLAEASTQLVTYTAEGEGVIRAELKRRGLPDPLPITRSNAIPAAAGTMPAAARIESPPSVPPAIIAARWAAAAIDWALITLVGSIISAQLLAAMPIGGEAESIVVNVVLGVAYFGLFEGRRGASLGKFVAGLRVTSGSGGPVGLARAAGRAGLGWGAPLAASGLLGVLLPNTMPFSGMLTALVVLAGALFLPARRANGFQAWHDRWTDTQVAFDTRAAGIRDRVAAGLACLTFAAGLGAIVFDQLPPEPDWLQDQHIRDVAGALMLVAQLGGFLSLLIGLTAFQTTPAIARGVATLALGASSMALGCAAFGHIRYPVHTEAAAIGALRAINAAESTYSSSCAAGGYATDLAKAPVGTIAGFISPDLGSNGVTRSGYIITLTKSAASSVTDVGSPAATCNQPTRQPASSYFASANPVKLGRTGTRYFATDPRGTIYFSNSGPIANPIPADATFLQ